MNELYKFSSGSKRRGVGGGGGGEKRVSLMLNYITSSVFNIVGHKARPIPSEEDQHSPTTDMVFKNKVTWLLNTTQPMLKASW